MARMTESEFDLLISEYLERKPEQMDDEELVKRMSVLQSAADTLLNEYEKRGLLRYIGEAPVVPFDVPDSRIVETVLTRGMPKIF